MENWWSGLTFVGQVFLTVYITFSIEFLHKKSVAIIKPLWNKENDMTLQRRKKSLSLMIILIILSIVNLVYLVFFSTEITRMTIFLIVSTSILTTILMMLYFYMKYVFIPYFSEDGIIDKQIQILDKLPKDKS